MDIKSVIKEQADTGINLKKRGWAKVRDIQNGQSIIIWNELHPELKKQGYFKIKNGKDTLILNKHELTYLLRNV